MRGAARLAPRGDALFASYEWGAPLSGRGEDEFSVGADGRLRVATTNWVGGREIKYTQVYARKT